MKPKHLVWIAFAVAFGGTAMAQTIVQKEPRLGGMRRGEVLWVDDGTCPKGQIKQVTAGSPGYLGGGRGQPVSRDRKCVPRR